MSEAPKPVTAPELAHLIEGIANQLAAQMSEPLARLASALKPGQNVNDLPSEMVTFGNVEVQPGLSTILVPAQETRTRVTLIAADDGVFLTQGNGRSSGDLGLFLLPAGVPVRFHTRAAIYALAATDVVSVYYAVEFNAYGL